METATIIVGLWFMLVYFGRKKSKPRYRIVRRTRNTSNCHMIEEDFQVRLLQYKAMFGIWITVKTLEVIGGH